jgi:hypothetical protein
MPPKLFCLFLLLVLAIAGCKSQKATVTPTVGSSVPSATALGTLSNVALLEIKNDWNGYSDITPIVRHYKLKPQANGLVGNGSFAVGGYGGYSIQQQYTRKVSISPALTQQFLQMLSGTKIAKSDRYQPKIERADDYPDVTIYLKLADREVTFTSRSQGQNNVPWQIKIKTKNGMESFVSDSPNPAQALALLKAQIDHPGLEQAIDKHRQPKKAAKGKVAANAPKPTVSPSSAMR